MNILKNYKLFLHQIALSNCIINELIVDNTNKNSL